jgi:hypothetical protein
VKPPGFSFRAVTPPDLLPEHSGSAEEVDVIDDVLRAEQASAGRPAKASRVARAYLWSLLQKTRLIRLIQSLYTGFWVGLLTSSDLDSVDDAYYVGSQKRQSPIDYTSPEYNKRGLFDWERKAIETHFPPGGSIGLMAAGGGREVLALRRMSFRVEAWECQPEFIAAANALLVAEGFEPSVTYAPRNTVPAGAETYDGVVVGWGSYMHMAGRDRRVGVLRALRARVHEGSPILVSFYTRRPGDSYLRLAAGVANLVRLLLGRERAQLGDLLEPNFVHRFTEEEINGELADGGFELKWFALRPYSHAIGRATSADRQPLQPAVERAR